MANEELAPFSPAKIAAAGFRLSLLLNAAACQIAQSGIEIHSIAKGISLFSLMLKQVDHALQSSRTHHTSQASYKARELAAHGQSVFDEIEQMLDKLKATDVGEETKALPLHQRVKWCFRRQHVTYLLAHLESLKLSLSVMLQILRLGRLWAMTSVGAPYPTKEAIAQERAEAQNMIIVRYWSIQRLDRMWDAVEQEARDAENDQTNKLINAQCSRAAIAVVSPTQSIDALSGMPVIRERPIVSLGESDMKMSELEKSPKDMVNFSASVMDRMLMEWTVPPHGSNALVELQGSVPSKSRKMSHRSYYVSDEDDDDDGDDGDDGLDFEGHDINGYYLEGTTDNWRQPHSQEARQHAARLRRQYSKYQAHVENDSDHSTDMNANYHRRQKDQMRNSSGSTSPDSHGFGDSRPSSYSASSSWDNSDQSRLRSSDSKRATVSGARDVSNPDPSHLSTPRQSLYPPYPSSPSTSPRRQHYSPSHRPGPGPGTDFVDMPRPKPAQTTPAAFQPSSPSHGTPKVQFEMPPTSSPATTYGKYNGNLQASPNTHTKSGLYPPLRTASSSPSDRRHGSSSNPHPHPHHHHHNSSRNKRSRDDAKEFAKSATKGLLGISAIAGFMDALEAFSL